MVKKKKVKENIIASVTGSENLLKKPVSLERRVL